MTILEIGREKIPENGWELNRWSQCVHEFEVTRFHEHKYSIGIKVILSIGL